MLLNSIARVFTYLLHPIFVPLYGYSLLLFTNNFYAYFFPPRLKFLLVCIVFSFTCLLPLVNLFILLRLRIINSLKLDDGSERTFPYLVTSLFYFAMSYIIWSYGLPVVFKALVLAGGLCILLTALINTRWKISAHMVGIGGLTGATMAVSLLLYQNFMPWLYLLFGLSGILGFSRLRLYAHTPAQVYAGYILGLVVTFLFILVAQFTGLNFTT